MALPKILEGRGEELQRHLQHHPNERFWLVPVSNGAMLEGREPESVTQDEEERLLNELAALGRDLPVSPVSETYSRETIYADHD